MGGLAKRLPLTYKAFLIGTLALVGFPPWSGFFSKDLILAHALAESVIGPILWVAGLIGALLTALYAFRLLFIVFHGEPSEHVREHLHKQRLEGGLTMMLPVGALSVLAIVAGLIQIPGAWHAVDNWIEPVAESLQTPCNVDGDCVADRGRRSRSRGDMGCMETLGSPERRARASGGTASARGQCPGTQALLRRVLREDALNLDPTARRRPTTLRRGAPHPRYERRDWPCCPWPRQATRSTSNGPTS